MKNISIILLFFLIASCSSKEKNNNSTIEVDKNYQDDQNFENYIHKYGFTENDTPAWYMNDTDGIVIEEIAESFEKSSVEIQGFSLDSLLKGSAVKNLGLTLNNSRPEINFNDYLNEKKTLYLTEKNNQLKHITIYDLRGIDVTLEEINLSTLNLVSYKNKYPGSYSLRNLFSLSASSHLAPLDSIKSIQHTFLWTSNGRLDLIWVNERPHMLDYWVF